jgi:signal recognition particle subunit SRP68
MSTNPSFAPTTPENGALSPQPIKKFSLDILSIIKTSQAQYGLRHQDYQRYRRYCTRRIARIRKSLKFTHGRGHFQARKIDATTTTDERYLLLVLVKAERAWSYAMQLKQDMEIQTDNPRLRFHMQRRLDKAAKWAIQLEKLCAAVADEHSALEAEAYAAYMNGHALLEREEWEPALDSLVKARTIYDQLGKVVDVDLKEMCRQRVEEIDPSIRYCNYNLRKAKGDVHAPMEDDTHALIEMRLKSNELLTSKLDGVLAEARKKHASSMKEVGWKGKRIPVRSEKVQVYLLAAQEVQYELEQSPTAEAKLPLYDKLFAALADASRVLKEDVQQSQKLTGKAKSGKMETQEQNLISLQEYVMYLKSVASIQRSLVLVELMAEGGGPGAKKHHRKPDDTVRIYEGIIQNLSEIADLEGNEDAEKAKETAAKILSFKAFRCYWQAQSFAVGGRIAESKALFDRSLAHVATARAHHEACALPDAAELRRLDALEKAIRGAKCKAHAKKFAVHIKKQEGEMEKAAPSKILLQSLNTYDKSFLSDKKLIDLPPDFEPIGCKPLLFDLAFNSLTFPNLEARKKTQKGGFFSFWRS